MHVHRLLSLGIALAVFTAVVAEPTASSYNLQELRAIARAYYPTLRAADAAVEAAVGGLDQAGAYPNPGLRVGFGRGRPRDGGDSRSESEIELVQPIERPGIRKWRTRLAELRVDAIELDRVLAQAVVDSTVSRLVYAILLEQRRARIAGESAELASRLHALLQSRVELGESSPLEAVKARSEWFARRSDAVAAESALAATRSALRRFCGDWLPGGFEIAERLEGPGAAELPADLYERLHAGNPVLLRARIETEQAQARTAFARKESFPRFDLIAAHDTELDRTATSLGIGVSIPLWNRNRGQIAAAAAEQVRATADTHTLVRELERSLDRASAAYRVALAEIRLHQDGWTATARKALDIATFSFENGEASLLDVLDAQRSHLAVRSAEAASWAALATARAEIELLVAGPLKPEETDETP